MHTQIRWMCCACSVPQGAGEGESRPPPPPGLPSVCVVRPGRGSPRPPRRLQTPYAPRPTPDGGIHLLGDDGVIMRCDSVSSMTAKGGGRAGQVGSRLSWLAAGRGWVHPSLPPQAPWATFKYRLCCVRACVVLVCCAVLRAGGWVGGWYGWLWWHRAPKASDPTRAHTVRLLLLICVTMVFGVRVPSCGGHACIGHAPRATCALHAQ